MAAEEVLDLFDFCWFVSGVFSSKTLVRPCVEEISAMKGIEMMEEPLKVSRLQTLHTRSRSDGFLSSKTTENLTADRIPNSPKLQTIFSGKEVGEELPEKTAEKVKEVAKKGRVKEGRRRKVLARGSKSLSELEFMELKGFMDLGFVFSEEEYENSNLVSIIPALQRLGRRIEEEEEEEEEEGSVVSRPYLSEAWEAMDESMKKRVLMNWRVPVLGTTEIAMKDHLKFWAQTVASTVR